MAKCNTLANFCRFKSNDRMYPCIPTSEMIEYAFEEQRVYFSSLTRQGLRLSWIKAVNHNF